MTILSILNELAADNSRLAKEAILKREVDNELLKKVLLATYDPTIQYFIRKIPKYVPVETIADAESLSHAIDKLDDLKNRVKTGNTAIQYLQGLLNNLYVDDAIVLERIIGGDLKCGVSVATINKIWKELIPEVPYMRCSGFSALPKNVDWGRGVISQVKADGSFVNINHHEDGTIEMFTRGGKRYDVDGLNFYNIYMMVRRDIPKGFQIHGEFLVEEGGEIMPREKGNGVLNSVAKGGDFAIGQKPKLEVWDIIPIKEAVAGGSFKTPYRQRLSELANYLVGNQEIKVIETKIVYSLNKAMDHYRDCLSRGLEGTIIKLPNAIWEDKTSKGQFKVKVELDVELEIVGFTPGNGKNEKTFGSITFKSSDDLVYVNVSGISDKDREEFHKNRNEMVGKIATVRCNSIMSPSKEGGKYSLFLPRFIELREEKREADSLQKIKEQYESIVNP